MTAVVQPPMTYFGGKTRLARRIASFLPPHEHYVEPFAGSLAVLLAKAPTRLETVSDLDGHLVNFWRVLREQPDELRRVCALTPHSRAEHQAAYDLSGELTDLERARRVWVQLTQSRMGVRTRTGWRCYVDPAGTKTAMPGYLDGYVDRMAAAAARLHNVSLESRPALRLIEDYGRSPQVLIYADPPYLGSTRKSGRYKHEMLTAAEHEELAAGLHQARAGSCCPATTPRCTTVSTPTGTALRSPPPPAKAAPAKTAPRSSGPTGPSATPASSRSDE